MMFLGDGLFDRMVLYFLRGRSVLHRAGRRLINHYLPKLELRLRWGDIVIKVRRDDFVSNMLVNHGIYEADTLKLIAGCLHENDIFIDIGANIGLHTLIAAKSAKARVFSIEPHPSVFVDLQNNVRVNNCDNVTLLNFPIFDQSKLIEFQIHESGSLSSSRLKLDERAEYSSNFFVHAFDFKLFFNAFPMERVKLIKIDTEGIEDNVLLCVKEINEVVDIENIVIEVRPKVNPKIVGALKIMSEHNYKMYNVQGVEVDLDVLENLPDHNLLLRKSYL